MTLYISGFYSYALPRGGTWKILDSFEFSSLYKVQVYSSDALDGIGTVKPTLGSYGIIWFDSDLAPLTTMVAFKCVGRHGRMATSVFISHIDRSVSLFEINVTGLSSSVTDIEQAC
jgi:hypothetical protein